ncbi:hemolysin-III related-domain-containing protein [Pseudomassariella vexata]|uniref:Hemolysin-III related-domain-containing protein n=1 Tax=Pseudomassariella vexata TaxID=1141098 RepID=A0A1Y2EIV0_9PEZI|nr:hemolysin-III related-domain-containing protein [Pseudomassariella vexata]ORY71499.1 hemolysin-III related-domain-containing protein [Pseudomassariella vexata]
MRSWTYMHNESVNIFSHVLGAFLFLMLPFYIFSTEIPPRYKVATAADIIVFCIYLLGVATCFTFSTIFHTFMTHSQPVYNLGVKLDYQGILLLMWGSTIPLIYYSFPCRNVLQASYWTATTALAGLCSFATFHPSIGGPYLGHVRAMLFGAFGLGSFLVPIAHGILIYGFAEQSAKVGFAWIGVTVLSNATGVLAYGFKVPETWYPRKFDIFGASHQIMHIMVVFAALAYTLAVLAAFDYRHKYRIIY